MSDGEKPLSFSWWCFFGVHHWVGWKDWGSTYQQASCHRCGMLNIKDQ